MPPLVSDFYGHNPAATNGSAANLVAAAVGVVTPGTISGTTNAGANPTITAANANDTAGNFTLTAVTGGGAQAAGAVCNVTFVNPYAAVPKHVAVYLVDQAAPGTPILAGYGSLTAAGFTVTVAAVLVTAHLYTVSYVVIP